MPITGGNFTGRISGPSGLNPSDYVTLAQVQTLLSGISGVTGFVPTTRNVIAGAGLSGGGPLSSDVTLNAGAGTGILIGGSSVNFDTSFGDGRYALSGTVFPHDLVSPAHSDVVGPAVSGHILCYNGTDWLSRPLPDGSDGGFVTAGSGINATTLTRIDILAGIGIVPSTSGLSLDLNFLDSRYAFSGMGGGAGFNSVGSGLYANGNQVGFDTVFGDTRYALSGANNILAGSGLILDGDNIHVQTGSGLYLQDDLVGVDLTFIQASGNYVTKPQADGLYQPSGVLVEHTLQNHSNVSGLFSSGQFIQYNGTNFVPVSTSDFENLEAGSGLVKTSTAYHVQVGSGLYLEDDLVGADIQSLGTFFQASGQYVLSGTSYTKSETNSLYAESGFAYAAGSGLVSTGENYHVQTGSGLYLQDDLVGVDLAFLDGRYALSGSTGSTQQTNAGSGLIRNIDDIHVQVGSGLYLQDDLVGFDVDFGDTRYALSGTIPGLGALAGSGLISDGTAIHVQVGSGLYLDDNIVGVDLTQVQSSGNYVTLNQANNNFAASGFHYAAGSGLIETGENYHVQVGSGLYLEDDLVGFDTNFGDIRYALSGTIPGVGALAGSGLITNGGALHVQVGSGLYLQEDLLGVDFTLVQPSGDYVTQAEADNLYAASGYHYAAGSGLIETGENYHVQIGSGLYLLDDLVGSDIDFFDTRYALSGSIPGLGALAGSGLVASMGNIHVQVGSGLYLQDNLVGVNFDLVQPSGDYVTNTEANNQFAASGFHYAAGSGLTETGENYHVQVGSGLYLQDDLVGVDFTQVQTSGDYLTNTEGDLQYLRLDLSNDPLIGDLDITGNLNVTQTISGSTVQGQTIQGVSGIFGNVDDNNYVEITASGIILHGGAREWQDLRVHPYAVKVGTRKIPAFGTFRGALHTYIFEDNIFGPSAGPQEVYFNIQLPHGTDVDTPLRPHVHFSPLVSGNTNVEFFLEYSIGS
jgi:hypothetical protein